MTVAPSTEQALRDAMERLLAGRPERTDGKLTKNNLWREAGVSRATMNRATDVLAEWDARAQASPAALQHRQRDHELAELRGQLRKARQEKRQLQDQVDAAATVSAALLAENTALHERGTRHSAVVVPMARPAGPPSGHSRS